LMRPSAPASATAHQSKPPPEGGGEGEGVRRRPVHERWGHHGVTVVVALEVLLPRFGSVVVVVTFAVLVMLRGTPWTVI
jgi:hypothetical protein